MCDHQDTSPATKPALRGRWRRWCVRIILSLLVLYVVSCAALYLLQDWMLFPTGMIPSPPSPTLPDGTVVMWIDIEGGDRVEGWFIPAPGCDDQHPAGVVIFFHGNGELIDYQTRFIDGYHRLGWSVLLPEYRGYARSGGRPSQLAIRSDMVRFYDALAQRADVNPSRIIFHGRSLGGAVAADLASQRKPAALILQSTFASTGAVLRPLVIPPFLIKHPFRTDRVIQSLNIPILIFHGTHDGVIRVTHGRSLHKLAGPTKSKYIEYPCGHNDLPGPDRAEAYWHEIATLLKKVSGRLS